MFEHYDNPEAASGMYVAYAEDLERLDLTRHALELVGNYTDYRNLDVALDVLVTLGRTTLGIGQRQGDLNLSAARTSGDFTNAPGMDPDANARRPMEDNL